MSSATQKRKVAVSDKVSLKSGFSIKKTLNPEVEEKKDELRTGELPRDTVSAAEVQQVWDMYASTLEKQGKMLMANILKARKPSLEGETIYLILDHTSGELEYQNEKSSLLTFLKSKLNNYYIELHHRIAEKQEKPKKAYTLKDKLKVLQEENPAVLDLVKKLNLDPDA